MTKMTNAMIKFCKENKSDRKIFFSSANTPGEGEHKLLQYIKDCKEDYKWAIYGLDADLIFLSLSVDNNDIYLVRENNQLNKSDSEELQYVSIDKLKACVLEEISFLVDDIDELETKKVIRDFVFICYFLGNDFLPHIPSIDIKSYKENINGLDLLLQGWANTYESLKDYIIKEENGEIIYNTEFLQMFLEYLSQFENEFFTNMYDHKKFYFIV